MSEKPVRVQLKRTKGWRMPENTVKVDRTTRWGNPFTLDFASRETSLLMYRELVTGFFNPSHLKHLSDDDFNTVYNRKQRFWHRNGAHPYWPLIRGKNLACWCKLDEVCHADILLELANPQPTGNIPQPQDSIDKALLDQDRGDRNSLEGGKRIKSDGAPP